MIRDARRVPATRRAIRLWAGVALVGALGACTGTGTRGSSPAPVSSDTEDTGAAVMTYRCESGATVQAAYPTDSVALVRYRGDTRELAVTEAASGVRYVGDTLRWWTQGTGEGATATLYTRDGETVVERCAQLAR